MFPAPLSELGKQAEAQTGCIFGIPGMSASFLSGLCLQAGGWAELSLRAPFSPALWGWA